MSTCNQPRLIMLKKMYPSRGFQASLLPLGCTTLSGRSLEGRALCKVWIQKL